MERGREEKKLRQSEKGRRESQAVHNAKDVNKYSTVGVSLYLVAIFDHLLHTPPFIPPSLHPRSSLAPPSHHPSITFTQPSQPYPPLPPTLPPTTFHLLHPLSVSFGEGKKLWRSGEARRRESQQVGKHWHMQKAMKSIHFTLHARQTCLSPPCAL